MKLDRELGIPLHEQLETVMREKIRSGEWAVGKAIPSENRLCQEYGLSRMTVRRVIGRLEQEGIVERIMGKGTYVSPPKMRCNLKFDSIIDQLGRMGYEISTKVISIEKKVLPAASDQLMLPDDSEYYEIKRVRTRNGEPMSAHLTYVPVQIAPDLEKKDLNDKLLYKVLEQDYLVVRGLVCETWRADKPPRWVCGELQIKPSEPVLTDMVVAYGLDRQGVTLEYEYYRGDMISLYMEFQ